MIRAILPDADNTLLDFNQCACAAMYDAARDFSPVLPENAFPTFEARFYRYLTTVDEKVGGAGQLPADLREICAFL